MENRILTTLFLATGLILCGSNSLMAQKRNAGIKSVEVFEEKFEKDGTSKKHKVEESKFDEQGNEIERIEYVDGKVAEKHTYTYDEHGNKISEVEIDAEGKKDRTEYKYENNLRTEKLEYSEKGRLKKHTTYVYKKR